MTLSLSLSLPVSLSPSSRLLALYVPFLFSSVCLHLNSLKTTSSNNAFISVNEIRTELFFFHLPSFFCPSLFRLFSIAITGFVL